MRVKAVMARENVCVYMFAFAWSEERKRSSVKAKRSGKCPDALIKQGEGFHGRLVSRWTCIEMVYRCREEKVERTGRASRRRESVLITGAGVFFRFVWLRSLRTRTREPSTL